MVEKKQSNDLEDIEIFVKLWNWLNKHTKHKNLIRYTKFVLLFYLLLLAIFLISIKFESLSQHIIKSIFSVVFFVISVAFIYIAKYKIAQKIKLFRLSLARGEIIFLKCLYTSNLFILSIVTFIYNGLILIVGIFFIFTYLYFVLFLITFPIYMLISLFMVGNHQATLTFLAFMNLFYGLSLIIPEFFREKPVAIITKKELLLFLFNQIDYVKGSERYKRADAIFKFLGRFSYSFKYKEHKIFMKEIIKYLSQYYKKIAYVLVNEKKIFSKYFPDMKQNIINSDYKALIHHLHKIDEEAKRNNMYSSHLKIIHNILKIERSADLMSMSKKLHKLKPPIINEENIFKRIWEFFSEHSLGKWLIRILALSFLLYLAKQPIFENFFGWLNVSFDNPLASLGR